MPRAALLADLAALRPADLATRCEPPHPSIEAVPDAEGNGSTLVTAARARVGVLVRRVSFGRHVALGCAVLELPDSTLRRDVDTPAQLEAARTLGLGPRTAALLA